MPPVEKVCVTDKLTVAVLAPGSHQVTGTSMTGVRDNQGRQRGLQQLSQEILAVGTREDMTPRSGGGGG
jgi:hypothetical protein